MSLLSIAPGFHLAGTWAGRLMIGPVSWRVPEEAELAALLGEARDGVQLFALPGHLLTAFWALIERGGLDLDGAKSYFAEVARFLDYKRFAPPAGAVFEVVARQQGKKATTLLDPSLWGAANLGNEPTHVVFVASESLVRVRLEPGEGYRLPVGVAVGGCTLGKEEPELLLVIRQPTGTGLAFQMPSA